MEWMQLAIIIVTLGGLFLWNRSESNSDRRMFYQLLTEMKDEMRDFHGRLASLDERTRK